MQSVLQGLSPRQRFRLIASLAACLSLSSVCASAKTTSPSTLPETPSLLRVSIEESDLHRIGNGPIVRVSWFRSLVDQLHFSEIPVRAIVDTDGRVTSAQAISDNDEFAALYIDAETSVRALRYAPFERNGHAVWATIEERVRLLPPEIKPLWHARFPNVRDWNSVVITLTRTGCLGSCPDYRVEVHGDGMVFYEGGYYVAITGKHKCAVPQENVRELVSLFKKTDYFSLRGSYVLGVTDGPTFTSSIRIDGEQKSVRDYIGEEVGMPISVSDLEDSIDRLSKADRWIKGTAETVSCLKNEAFNFQSADAAKALAGVAASGTADAVRDFVEMGAPVDGKNIENKTPLVSAAAKGDVEMLRVLLGANGGAKNPSDLEAAAMQAAWFGKFSALTMLLTARGSEASASFARELLISAAASGVPDVVQEALKKHPDLMWHDKDGLTALIAAAGDYRFGRQGPEDGDVDRAQVVRVLLRAGADPNARDNRGNTALIEAAWDADAALELIRAGADVNAQDDFGISPLINCVNPEVARILLQNGANPAIRDRSGKTALESSGRAKAEVISKELSGRKK